MTTAYSPALQAGCRFFVMSGVRFDAGWDIAKNYQGTAKYDPGTGIRAEAGSCSRSFSGAASGLRRAAVQGEDHLLRV